MPRTCTICIHPARSSIDQDLIARVPFRHIAAQTGTSTTALQRHKRDHIPLTLRKAHDAEEVAHAGTLLDQIRELQSRAMRILDTAEEAGDLRTALAAIGQARGVLELQAKMTGETDDRGTGQDEPLSAAALRVFIGNIIALPKQPGVEEGPMPSFEGGPMIELEPEAAEHASLRSRTLLAEPEEVAYI